MYQDEAERIAAQIRRTIAQETAQVVQVENPNHFRTDTWSVKCYEVHPPLGGPGVHVSIATVRYWLHLQGRWFRIGKQQDTQS